MSTSPTAIDLLLSAIDSSCVEGVGSDEFATSWGEMNWDEVIGEAENQGLGPIVYHCLMQANAHVPDRAKISFQGLYLRHRRANRLRIEILREILAALEARGIDVLVLKGAALAHLIYSEPGLRPMRDLDLLVHPADALPAGNILSEMGFQALQADDEALPGKHLQNAMLQRAGITVSVEVHYNLFERFATRSMTLETLRAPPMMFDCGDLAAFALGPGDMLLHLSEHIAYHASIWEPIRLIWIVDLVTYAERFVDVIDWEEVRTKDPIVIKQLSLFHHVVPLSQRLQAASGAPIALTIGGIGREFKGWPRYRWRELRMQSPQDALRETLFPSEWWLRLHYRLNSTESLAPYRWLWHPLYVLGPLYLWEKVRLFWHLQAHPMIEAQRKRKRAHANKNSMPSV